MEQNWVICTYLEMVNFLLGHQGGCRQHPCFICLWVNRTKAEHRARKDWPLGDTFVTAWLKVINELLVPKDRILN